jgi:hypothetical protein
MSSAETISPLRPQGIGAAPGQYLGYGLQTVRMCVRLLQADSSDHVSIEQFDDVAVRRQNGRFLLEQSKSALTQNPVADWSTELWKTFANWLGTTARLGLDPAETDYVLYVSPAKSGNFAAALHGARTDEHVRAILAEIRQSLSSRKPPACQADLLSVLDSDAAIVCAMFRNFSLAGCPGDPVDTMRRHLAPTVPPAIMDIICEAAIGWVKRTTDELIRAGKIAEITASAFHVRLRGIIKRHDRDEVLHSFAPRPDHAALQNEMQSLYIRQLDAIEIDSDEKLRAATDYLLGSSDRTIWSDLGHVHEVSLDQYDDELTRKWSHRQRVVAITNRTASDIDRGKLLYAESMQTSERLQGKDVPSHFTPGSYHSLADRQKIRWHPNFQDRPASRASEEGDA